MSSVNDNDDNENDDDHDLPCLKGLMSALASFAKATQGLPNNQDDFAYESSFPEFQTALQTTQASLLELLQTCCTTTSDESEFTDIEDPMLWEECADLCDSLIEQVEQYVNTDMINSINQFSDHAKARYKSKLTQIAANTNMDMEKPQQVHAIVPHNSRIAPFVPTVHPDKPHGIVPLDLTLLPGHGYDTRFGALRTSSTSNNYNTSMIAPTQYCPHVYEKEILNFQYTPEQLHAPQNKPKQPIEIVEHLQAKWIDTEDQLRNLAATLDDTTEIAIDLEAHSYRSFTGIVCLMQISIYVGTNIQNYLVDTLKLYHVINKYLASPLANPQIVKVLHGADSDIQWFQRDFGLYIVNMFDTGRAARALSFKSASYAYLLQKYCNITADKSHQLADWRVRPLPEEMQQYAIQDTHYLLDIYHHLKYELEQHPDTSIRDVLDVSRQVCLIRYCPEPFFPDGYRKLLLRNKNRGRNNKTELSSTQEAVLLALWDWRDQTARNTDESVNYICTNQQLLRLATSSPTTSSQLQNLFNPIPPLVLQNSQEILNLIKRAVVQQEQEQQEEEENDDVQEEAEVIVAVGTAPSSAFFKPAINTDVDEENKEETGNEKNNHNRRSDDGRMLRSPVLGTEALYKQAGWMTPVQNVISTKEDDDDAAAAGTTSDDDEDPTLSSSSSKKLLLSVHTSNQEFHSKEYEDHNLKFGDTGAGRNADGLGSVRAARRDDDVSSPPSTAGDDTTPSSLNEEVRAARESAARIKSDLVDQQKDSIPTVLGLAVDSTSSEQNENTDTIQDVSKEKETSADLEEEFVIPRSIREIYMISNRNRRNKKAGSPTPERGATPTSEKEREELAKAEAVLKARGDAYFDASMSASPGKRARTKSGRESEESVPDPSSPNIPSKEDDLAFMKEIGWLQSKEEADGVLQQRYGRNRAEKKGYNDESGATAIGLLQSGQQQNPFFAGAAMQGGPLAQAATSAKADPHQRQRKSGPGGKGKQNRGGRQERPEKKDGRTYAYRKR